MYSQISANEYHKLKIIQDFELRDFEELSLFLIGLENDIDYSRIEDNGFLIKFWGKKNPDFFYSMPGQDYWIPVHYNPYLIFPVWSSSNVTTSTTSTTTTLPETKQKKVKYYNPIQVSINICKIPDEYFLVDIYEEIQFEKSAYFKVDQIDGLVELIKFVFDASEMATIKKIEEAMDSIINL